MRLENLQFTKMNTNFMGSLHGIAKYYGYHYSQQWLLGGTGHAFMMNIHKELCPSGPYVFELDPIFDCAKNLGLQFEPVGFVHGELTPEVLAPHEDKLRVYMDQSIPVIIQNMDNQIMVGYDETGFLLDPTYEDAEEYFPPKLTFGSWEEYGDEVHSFSMAVRKIKPAHPKKVIKDSLDLAIKLLRNEYPQQEPQEGIHYYATGFKGYEYWLEYLDKNNGNTHGHYWNGSVWMECRKHAAMYFHDLPYYEDLVAKDQDEMKLINTLENKFNEITELLNKARVKESPRKKKLKFIKKASMIEESSLEDIISLRNRLD
ncbi:MAG: hypothetical protein EU530_09330 [Promethearchaeota archaeon]|nr:MAG: hypothetical protein EU530_09330 [Candidatus Lokiarchaeota archaeon]